MGKKVHTKNYKRNWFGGKTRGKDGCRELVMRWRWVRLKRFKREYKYLIIDKYELSSFQEQEVKVMIHHLRKI